MLALLADRTRTAHAAMDRPHTTWFEGVADSTPVFSIELWLVPNGARGISGT